ncbi:hypothetical protein J6590_076707 [Homalodisca vitripennis]|nr:hypothetical protein J6590_076707 [Homalodisca vitripennis]
MAVSETEDTARVRVWAALLLIRVILVSRVSRASPSAVAGCETGAQHDAVVRGVYRPRGLYEIEVTSKSVQREWAVQVSNWKANPLSIVKSPSWQGILEKVH